MENTDVEPKKRGGRKPGSKNKPKLTIGDVSGDRIPPGYGAIQPLKAAMTTAAQLLERAVSIRIGLNDSDNRVADLNKQRQQLEQEALTVLRAAL